MTTWRMICGGYYEDEKGRHIYHQRPRYRTGQARRWYIGKLNPRNGYEHPDWEHPYPTLKAAQEAAG